MGGETLTYTLNLTSAYYLDLLKGMEQLHEVSNADGDDNDGVLARDYCYDLE